MSTRTTDDPRPSRPGWSDLGSGARLFRLVHAGWSVAGLSSLAYLWACVLSGRRDRRLGASVAFLLAEGAGLAVGRGNCPASPFQHRLGDQVPFFELVLPPRWAKRAVPILLLASVAGLGALVLRSND